MRAEQAMRIADTALDNLGGEADASSDPVPDVEFNEEEVLGTCSDFIKVMQSDTSCCSLGYVGMKTKSVF